MGQQEYDLVVVDGDNIAYKNFYANYKLQFNGHSTGALFGFLKFIIKAYKSYGNKLIITWSHNNNYRKRIEPSYKETRDKSGLDDYYPQRRLIEKALSSLGIIQVMFNDLEADDAISSIIRSSNDSKCLIISEDKDLLQLVSDKVHQLKREMIFTPNLVKEKYGVTPDQFPLYLSIIGDKSDNIIGVKGVGKKRAAEVIQNFPELLEVKEFDPSLPKFYHKVFNNLDIIKKNLKLIDLSLVPIMEPKDNLLKINRDFKEVEKILYDNGIFSLIGDLKIIYGR